MLKGFKKLVSLVLVLAVSMVVSVPAFAQDKKEDSLSLEAQRNKQIVEQLKREMEDERDSIQSNIDSTPHYSNSEINSILAIKPQSKTGYRLGFRAVASAAKLAGLRLTAECLSHSLNDNPSDVIYNRGSWQSNEIKSSPDYEDIIEYIKPQLDNQPDNYWSCDGSVNFESPDDVLLSIHSAAYLAGAEKLHGVWNIYIRFFDTYDFNYHDIGGTNLAQDVVDYVNNEAVNAQQEGAIVPYDITIYTGAAYAS